MYLTIRYELSFQGFCISQNYDFIDLDLNRLYYAVRLSQFFRDWVLKNHTYELTILSILINLINNILCYFLKDIFKVKFFT